MANVDRRSTLQWQTAVGDRRCKMTFKPRLTRLKRLYTQCPVYFLTPCTENRHCVLANNEIHHRFIEFADEATRRHVLVGRYMIMPDHIHLFAAFNPLSPTLPSWMKALKGSLSEVLREKGGEGTHWQKDYFDHVLRSEESFRQKWEYVRQNPVRAGLVKRSEDWPYQGEIHHL